MNTKFLLLFIMFLSSIFSFKSYAGQVDLLDGNVLEAPATERNKLRSEDIANYIKANIDDHILTLEFFQSSADVTITVTDENGIAVYNGSAAPCPTLHSFIYLNQCMPGYYTVRIYNNSGINLEGTFWLD